MTENEGQNDTAKPAEPGEPEVLASGATAKNGEDTQASPPAGEAPKPLSERELLTAERDKLREQLLRTAADFDNFRKRTRRDLDDARIRGKDEVIRDLLPVFDNLELAVQTAGAASDVKSVVDGVRMVLKLFEDSGERMGLARIKTLGERFDPAVHEALQQLDTPAHPPGTIVAEIAAGYRFGDRLVRPARVVVARKPPDTPSEPPKRGPADPASGSAKLATDDDAAQPADPATAAQAPKPRSNKPPPEGAGPEGGLT